MSEIVRIVEQIGIDIVLTGVFVLATFFFGWSIGRATTVLEGITTVTGDIPKAAQHLCSMLTIAPSGDRRPWMSIVAGVGILALAAMTGRVFTLIGDEVLDSDLIAEPVFLYVPPLGELRKREWDNESEWDDEDTIKRQTLKDAREWSRFVSPIHDVLGRHVDQSEVKSSCGDSRNDCARGFFQHANAIIRERASDETRGMLSREASIAEFLSVVFVSVWVLFFATLFGPVRKSLMPLIVQPGKKELWGKLAKNITFLAWLWIAEGIALRLWTEQTTLLDRRVIYSYLAIASEGDPAMGVPPAPSDPVATSTLQADDSGR